MTVIYGTTYIRQPVGICKIIEILFCLLVIMLMNRHSPAIVGLILSMLILTISSTSLAQEIHGALKFQYIALIIVGVWLALFSSLSIKKKQRPRFLVGCIAGVVTGAVYLTDGVFTLKDYD